MSSTGKRVMKPHMKISVSKSKFKKEAVLATCCELATDKESFLLQKSKDGKFYDVLVTSSAYAGNDDPDEEKQKTAAREFRNLLYEKQIQITILKNNIKTCEEIVYNALSNPKIFKEEEPEEALPESIAKIIEESSAHSDESYLDDILNIAVPWEEKNK